MSDPAKDPAQLTPLKSGLVQMMLALSNWGHRWSGLIGILIALAALGGTWYSGLISREHNKLIVKPNIRFAPFLEGAGRRNGIYIENEGLGPARLTKLTAVVGGQSYDLLKLGGQRAALRAMDANLNCFLDIQPEIGTVLRSGQGGPLMAMTNATPSDLCLGLVALTFMKRPIELHAEYLSAYDERLETHQVIRVDSRSITDRLPLPQPR